MDDQYIDVLKTGSESIFPAYVRIKAQAAITRLEEQGIFKILEEYYRLSMLPELSPEETEEDMARLAEILVLAEQDEMLQLLIEHVDCILDSRMGLLNSKTTQEYEKQQAWLNDNLAVEPPDPDFHRMLQLRLRELGLYEGPIDGVMGKRSRTAVVELQKSHSMQADGIPNPQTISILLEKTGVSHD